MPWSDNSGNGGRDPTEGPWGSGGDGGGPRHSGNSEPPGLDDLFRSSQDRLKDVLPSGGGSNLVVGLVVLIGFSLFWAYNSFYTIKPEELGVELRFGKPKEELSRPGLHFLLWPIERLEIVKIVENQINVGAKSGGGRADSGLMLSADQNIVDVAFTVLWRVEDPIEYLFNVRDPQGMVRQVAESAMREVVGRRPAQSIFRDDRAGVAEEVLQIARQTLQSYEAGIAINGIQLEDVAPPPSVAEAFDDVQRAEQDESRFIEEANRDKAKDLGEARGKAAQIREEAAGYKARVVQEAQGEAQRFISVYDEYAKAPEVTRQRLFFETVEKVLKSSDKVILEGNQGSPGVVPYLPLPELNKRRGESQ